MLDYGELQLVLQSKTLGLNLSKEEIRDIIAEADSDSNGSVNYTEFVPLLRDLMKKIYAVKDDNRNDWSMLKNEETGKVLYLNKRTGKYQSSKPLTFNENRIEFCEYENITTATGESITIRDTAKYAHLCFTSFKRPISSASFSMSSFLVVWLSTTRSLLVLIFHFNHKKRRKRIHGLGCWGMEAVRALDDHKRLILYC